MVLNVKAWTNSITWEAAVVCFCVCVCMLLLILMVMLTVLAVGKHLQTRESEALLV